MALQVDPDDVVPVRLVHVEAHLVPQDAGVVDQDVELAEGVDGLVDEVLGPLPRADVGGVDGAVAAARLDELDDLFGRVLVAAFALEGGPDVVDDDLGALGGQQQGLLASDASSCAGDDGHLAVEHSHGVLLYLVPAAVARVFGRCRTARARKALAARGPRRNRPAVHPDVATEPGKHGRNLPFRARQAPAPTRWRPGRSGQRDRGRDAMFGAVRATGSTDGNGDRCERSGSPQRTAAADRTAGAGGQGHAPPPAGGAKGAPRGDPAGRALVPTAPAPPGGPDGLQRPAPPRAR